MRALLLAIFLALGTVTVTGCSAPAKVVVPSTPKQTVAAGYALARAVSDITVDLLARGRISKDEAAKVDAQVGVALDLLDLTLKNADKAALDKAMAILTALEASMRGKQ